MTNARVTEHSLSFRSSGPFKRGYPLRYTIAFVFTLLTLVSGVALIVFNYIGNEKATILAAHDLLERISHQVTSQVSALILPVQSVINISSKTIHSSGLSFETRLPLLEHFVEILRHNRKMASMVVADVDGDFFIVRSVENHLSASSTFGAPDGTRFIVQGIDREMDELVAEKILFLDENLFSLFEKTSRSTTYDHRRQGWFKASIYNHQLVTTEDYLLFGTQEIGLTIARRLKEGHGVVAADLPLKEMSARLAEQRVTPSTELILVNGQGTIVAHSNFSKIEEHLQTMEPSQARMPSLTDFDSPLYASLAKTLTQKQAVGRLDLTTASAKMLGAVTKIPIHADRDLFLAAFIPRDELLSGAIQLRNRSILISLLCLAITIIIVFWLSQRISTSLRYLSMEAQKIREFKLDTPIRVDTRILEVNDLADTMSMMKASIQQFLNISRALSEEKKFDNLLELILSEAKGVSGAIAGAVTLRSQDDRLLEVTILHNDRTGSRLGGTSSKRVPFEPIRLQGKAADRQKKTSVLQHVISSGEMVQVEDVETDDRFDYQEVRSWFDSDDFRSRSLLIVPLSNQKRERIGTLQLLNLNRGISPGQVFRTEIVSYIEALCSDAAVALDNRRLLQAQRDLIDSIIHLIAGSIDAKSPYTSKHCQRVPVLVEMLADAAQATEEGPFGDFSLTEEEKYALHLAGWLHDCGKVTTPEYVVDKATKLETLCNRIHEVRMRFEVLWRDAQIAFYRGVLDAPDHYVVLSKALKARLKAIQEDYSFVAQCNIGGEFMSDEQLKRLNRIAKQPWTRHLDDRIGISHEELERKMRTPQPELPVRERVLDDKPEHLVFRSENHNPLGRNPEEFTMDVPEYLYNYGEMTNLSIAKGTLTTEERFVINSHIVQTIRMLRALPLPRELAQVPDWAGNHHESFCGTGYPRGLLGKELSIPERMLAVADVFEALTASDRPYKPARKLSETLWMMSEMCQKGHLCRDTFALLLKSGVFRSYADAYINSEQLDEVDVSAILAQTKAIECT